MASGSNGETQCISMFQPSIARKTEANPEPSGSAAAQKAAMPDGTWWTKHSGASGTKVERLEAARGSGPERREGKSTTLVIGVKPQATLRCGGEAPARCLLAEAQRKARRVGQGGERRWPGAQPGEPAVDTVGRSGREGLTASWGVWMGGFGQPSGPDAFRRITYEGESVSAGSEQETTGVTLQKGSPGEPRAQAGWKRQAGATDWRVEKGLEVAPAGSWGTTRGQWPAETRGTATWQGKALEGMSIGEEATPVATGDG